MGSGKTEGCIKMMNEDTESKYIFITPFLDEIERIKNSCSERKFMTPNRVNGQKLNGLHILLGEKCNVANTHSLFRRYNSKTIELIKSGGYKLVLDEVFSVAEFVEISRKDITMLLDQKVLYCNEGRVFWNDESGYDGHFMFLRPICNSNNLVMSGGKLFYWLFPIEIFLAFAEVTILTYLFDAQVQKYYFDLHNIGYEKIGVDRDFNFTDKVVLPEYVNSLKEKIHIIGDEKLNAIGDGKNSLSKTWFTREKNRDSVGQLKRHVTNVFINKFQSPSSQNLWTTFKDCRRDVSGNGYKRGFTAYTLRATNKYRKKTHLAYCINVFFHPSLKSFFTGQGVVVDEDTYALSYMLQWVWRSAIRDGEEIWLYIPSRRMRSLFEGWMNSLLVNREN